MAGHFSIREWSQYQHYKDRDPPWIKLHRAILTSETWVMLDDPGRVLAVASMLIAAGTENKIPESPAYIRRRAYLDYDPDFAPLVDIGFLDYYNENNELAEYRKRVLASASAVLADARPEAEAEAEKSSELRSSVVISPNGEADALDPFDIPETFKRAEADPSANGKDRQPVQKAFDNWNIAAEEYRLPKAEKLTPERRRKLGARLREHGLSGWNRALESVGTQPFLTGDNARHWRADLDFMLQPTSLVRVLEGSYGDEP